MTTIILLMLLALILAVISGYFYNLPLPQVYIAIFVQCIGTLTWIILTGFLFHTLLSIISILFMLSYILIVVLAIIIVGFIMEEKR